jgi:MEMO1 family protein
MRLNIRSIYCCLVIGIAVILLHGGVGRAAEIREPVWAGGFYPADPAALVAVIDAFRQRAAATTLDLQPANRTRALVLPHAGYLYSGLTAAHAGRVLSPGVFRKVILLGPDHRVGFQHGAITTAAFYRTPLGLVKIHPDAATLLQQGKLFRSVPASEATEHSLEVLLPFLQSFLGSFELVPVVLGSTDPMVMAATLAPLLDQQTLLVVSSDLSHYLPYEEAVIRDRLTVDQLLALDADGLASGDNRACGREGLLVLAELARRQNWQPQLLHYANSGDTAGDKHRVVGYAALAFYDGERIAMQNPSSLDRQQGQYLVQLARQTIEEQLQLPQERQKIESLERSLSAPHFQEKRGVFVTLHKQGQLRGCIGSLIGYRSIVEGVREHAINAAFNDYRFRPVTGEEVADLEIEVSILSEPRTLDYADADDLLIRLRPGVDGVIIRQNGASATFLPQVWEQLPDPADFLNHLCQKAGLPPTAWRQGRLEVQTYQVQYFAEEK